MSVNRKIDDNTLERFTGGGSGGGSGGSANIWEGSHAEYEEEKSQIPDETTLLFNDDIGLEAESDYYSEVEQVIGTYLGKPLYRKVYSLTTNYAVSDTSWTEITDIGISDKQLIINCFAELATGTLYDFQATRNIGTKLNLIANRNGGCGLDNTTKLVLEYTKTTDSVVGVVGGIKKGDNYSTTERVIGTWIDSKPLYQKTISLGSLNYSSSSATWSVVAHNINNVKRFIKIAGFTFNSNDNRMYEFPTYRIGGVLGISLGADNTNLYYMNNWIENTQDTYVILEYIKTND